MMSRIPSYPTDDNDAAVFSSSSLSSENYHHDAQPKRLSSSSSSSSSSSNRRDSLPPTRMGQLKPGDVANPLRLVKAETNQLANQALETISAIERQRETKKSTLQADSSDVDWEQNLSSWKDRRKSKPTYQPKALEIGEEQEEVTAAGKRSKTFKELMDEKEKRSNGLGLYTYESEDSSGPSSRDTSTRDAAAVTSTSKASISSSSSTTTVIADAQPKVLDPISDASTQSSISHKREFYLTDSLVEGVSRELKTSLPASSGDLEAGTLLVQQRPQEISFEFRAPTEISAPETKVLIQKTSAAVETASSADSGSDSERKPWRSTDRRASALTSVGPSTSSSGVKLRDRPPGGGTQQPRPSSYAFTGYSDTRSAKTEVMKPPMRTPSAAAAAAQVSGSTARRESAGGGGGGGGGVRPPPDRQVNPAPPPGALTRDRRVKSNWELNFSQSFEKSDRQEFRPPPPHPQQQQKSAEASSSAKFKQALSLFQSKEAEAGRPAPPPPPKASLTTQRSSLGGPRMTSRLPVDESSSLKPIRATAGGGGGFETKRPIAATTSVPYRPSAETRTNRQTNETRPREYWGSVHGGLDGEDRDIPDRRRSMFDPRSKNEDNDDRYDWRKGDETQEPSYQRSFESDHSKRRSLVNLQSTDDSNVEDKSPSKDTDQTKNSVTRVENVLPEVGVLKSRVEINRNAAPAAAPAADDEREKIGVGSTVSWTLKLGADPSPGKAQVDISYDQGAFPETTRRRTSGIQSGVAHEYSRAGIPETRPRDGDEGNTRDGSISVPDWRMDQRRDRAQLADSTEPKSLYAFKYQTTNIEESIVESRDKLQAKAADSKTTSDVEKPSDTKKGSPIQTEGETTTKTRDLAELEEDSSYKMEDNSFSDSNSNRWNKQRQQSSISDIFSRRSADALRVRNEPDERGVVHRPFNAAPSPNTARDEQKYRKEVVEPTRREEESSTKFDVEIRSDRERHHDGELRAKNDVTDTQRLVGDVTAGSHDDHASQKAGPEVRGLDRTYGIGESSRRRYGLGRYDYAEEDRAPTEREERPGRALREPSERETQHYNLRQESAFEVNFSSFGSEKKSTGDGAEIDRDRFGGKMEDQPLVEGGSDGSSLTEPSEIRFERNEKTSGESSPGAVRHPPEDQKLISTGGDGSRSESHHEEFILEESLNNVAADMKLVELDSSAPFHVGCDSDSINLSRSSNGILTLSFTEADFVVGGGGVDLGPPETKSRRDDSEDFIRRDSPPIKPQNSGAASETKPRSLTEDESSPSSSPPPPLPLEKPPSVPVDSTKSPSFEFSFALPPPSRRMPSPEPASPEQMSPEPVSPEPVSPEPVRNTDAEKLIDFGADDKIGSSDFSKRDSMSEKSLTKAEIIFDDDEDDHKGVSVDGNSNISIDQTSIHSLPPANINVLQQRPPTVHHLSLDQAHDDSKAASLPSKEQQMTKTPQSSSEDTSSSAAVTSSVQISPNNPPPPPKKKPPEVPKTKPKPKIAPKSGDDWGFLANTQLLDTSANRDKCRLAREGPMAVRKRPKSAFIPSLDASDLFDVSNGGFINGYREEDAVDGGRDGARDLDLSAGNSEEAVSLRRPKVSPKGATRPLSYMGELNTSLAKKFRGDTAADNGREVLYGGDRLKDSTGNDPAANEPSSSRYGELEAVDSSEKMLVRPRGSVKMPGLMNELNLSLKKKFQDNSQDSSDRETEHSVLQREVTEEKPFRNATGATATSLKSIVANDDGNDDERGTDVPPPPLPNAPPPLPNWNSFPGDSPAGLPLPPSGPPPALIDFGSSGEEDDDSGKIQFRVDASAMHRQAPAPDQKWWQNEESEKTDEMDFSFA